MLRQFSFVVGQISFIQTSNIGLGQQGVHDDHKQNYLASSLSGLLSKNLKC